MELKKSGRRVMDLDDFKKLNYKDDVNNMPGESGLCITDLFDRVDKSFKKQMRQKRYFIIFLLLNSFAYLILAGTSSGNEGLKVIGGGFILGAVYLFFRYKPLPDEIYLLSLREFVDTAIKKLRYFELIDWIVVIPILIILGIGGWMQVTTSLSKYTDKTWLVTLVWIIFYIGLCIFGYFAGRGTWKEEHGSLLRYLERFREAL